MVIEDVEGSSDSESNSDNETSDKMKNVTNLPKENKKVVIQNEKNDEIYKEKLKKEKNIDTKSKHNTQEDPSTTDAKLSESKKKTEIKNMPKNIIDKKELGNDFFKRGQYDEALIQYNSAIQMLQDLKDEGLRKFFFCVTRSHHYFLLQATIFIWLLY